MGKEKKYEMAGQRSAKELAKQGHTAPVYGIGEPVPSRRQSTKGGPYSRCAVLDITPSRGRAVPAVFHLIHPTAKARVRRTKKHSDGSRTVYVGPRRIRDVKATPEIVKSLIPGVLPQQMNGLLGF